MSSPMEKAPLADPAPLGLAAFAFTAFLLSFANAGLTQLGGYIGFLTAGCAAYTSFAIVTNSIVGPGTVPPGPKILGKK
ncbi:MAG: hypothetical protein FJZ49_01925 [Candidatus Verstraetearchaeota archaeon]|nr:hypothetical protein [Candidatus Verstraetearchaeota archaeon]